MTINAVDPTPLGVDLPAGTVVTVTEGDRPEVTPVDWGAISIVGDGVTDNGSGSAQVVISEQQGDVTLLTITNEAEWATSTFTLAKSIVDNAGAEFVADGTVFSVHVQEFDPAGEAQSEYDLEVTLNGTPVTASNEFGPGWTAVLTEPTFPEVPGVHFGTPVFAETDGVTVSEDGATATVVYSPGENVAVSLTNDAELGSISIVKEIEGGAIGNVDVDRTYQVTASIDTSALGEDFPAQDDRVLTLTAGEPIIIADLPIGAVVTFSEAELLDDDILTWGEPVFSPESVTVTPDHVDEPAVVTLTNSVERTVGTFSITKLVTGAQADNEAVPATVTINATWDEEGTPGSKTLEVPTDGTPVPLGEDLLIGTMVTLTEVPLEDGSSIAWAAPAWSGDGVEIDGNSAVVTVGRNAEAAVVVENHAATSVAGLSIIKGIAGEAADEVAPETEFPVTVTWTDADDVEQVRELTINAVEPTPLGEDLPAGTVVTITEGDRPGFDTVIWDEIVISGDDVTDNGDGSADVVVSDQQDDVTLVTVTNEATWAPGTFTLVKYVEGVLLDNPDVSETVTIIATWVEADGETGDLVTVSRSIEVPVDGTPVDFGEYLPHGTEVTLVEDALAGNAAFTWAAPAWGEVEGLVINEDGTATLTIAAAQNPTVEITNVAHATLGNLSIVKELSGSGADLVPANTTYPVTATWTDILGAPQSVELELVAGEPATIENVPFGTEVTLTEGEFDVPATVTWEGAEWSADSNVTINGDGTEVVIVVEDEAGTAVSVTLDNDFDEIPADRRIPPVRTCR
ncbi:MAG: DUF5979 domain-containing protein [Flaviflexus sp.]|uniref:DUF5979 domain-containing protein n=1 Tax=Flaviflexus sp. TaxID=1969482 RepID=UPI00352FE6B0